MSQRSAPLLLLFATLIIQLYTNRDPLQILTTRYFPFLLILLPFCFSIICPLCEDAWLGISPYTLPPSFFTGRHALLSPRHSLWAVSLVPHKCNRLPFYRHNCDYIKDDISEPLFLSIDTQRGFFILEIQLLPFRLRHGLYPCCLITHSVCFRGLSARAECQMKLQSSATDGTTSTAKPGLQTQRVYRKICG